MMKMPPRRRAARCEPAVPAPLGFTVVERRMSHPTCWVTLQCAPAVRWTPAVLSCHSQGALNLNLLPAPGQNM